MTEYPNVLGMLREAAADPAMRDRARTSFAQAILRGGLLKKYPKRSGPPANPKLRLSSLGGCRLEEWYKQHGLLDLEPDVIDLQLTRFDDGAMRGAWIGALIAAVGHRYGWHASLEETHVTFGVTGHSDVRLHAGIGADYRSHIVEIKSDNDNYGAVKNPEKDSPFQLLQAAAYCWPDDETKRSQSFTLLVVAPFLGKQVRAKQFHFDAAPYRALVERDIERLQAALVTEPPTGDPAQKWRCFTCCASACSRNKNKVADDVAALLAS